MSIPKKLRFLIAYGPTEEPLDPVRYLSNRSTGTMGCRLAEAAAKKGHRVLAVECPRDARTARELQEKLRRFLPKCDVLIMAAAVCDARPAAVSKTKIKKEALTSVRLVKNPDILAGLARQKNFGQVFIGFGLESRDLLKNGFEKLKKKGLDLIVLQKVSSGRDPFGDKKIEAVFLSKDGGVRKFPLIGKERLAGLIIREAACLRSRVL